MTPTFNYYTYTRDDPRDIQDPQVNVYGWTTTEGTNEARRVYLGTMRESEARTQYKYIQSRGEVSI